MTIDPETLMAYADGELDPVTAKRVERAVAADPSLADEIARHRALRDRVAQRFASVPEETVPDRLTALLSSNVIAFPPPRPSRPIARWRETAAIAACLVIGIAVGHGWQTGPVATHGGKLYASGGLARALDTQLASNDGAVKVALTFRDKSGQYCRVFRSATDGIACREPEDGGWALRLTRLGSAVTAGDYRQAASPDADLMAAAQDMMAGEPLDAAMEAKARSAGWR